MAWNNELRIDLTTIEDVVVVSPAGRIVRENEGVLRDRLERLVLDGASRIAIDLQRVDYMDSAGLGCCSFVQKLLAERSRGNVAVFGLSRDIDKVWRLVRLDLVIPVFPDATKAVQWLRKPI